MLRAALAVLAVVLVVGAGFWLGRRKPAAPLVAAPSVKLTAPPTLELERALPLRVEVASAPAYVYLFRVEGGVATLEWAHPRSEPPWEAGEYEPEWSDGADTPFFESAGTNAVVAVAAAAPVESPELLARPGLLNDPRPCVGCTAAAATIQVTARQQRLLAGDAGVAAAPLAP